MSKIFTAIGLMSGTSMDGIDAAIIKTDGEDVIERIGQTGFTPYDDVEWGVLTSVLGDARTIFKKCKQESADKCREIIRQKLKASDLFVTISNEGAVKQLLAAHCLRASDVDVTGFHGQTVLHRPEYGLTVQLGDGQELADRTGISVVGDFRQADIKAGGQGAPMVPVYHQALVRQAGLELPVAVLNVGGVANVTYIGEDGELIAFDTGPGNALINDWVSQHDAGDMDRDGAIAARGRVKESVLSRLLADPYFSQDVPKSLDRNQFSLEPLKGLSLEWGAMTLTSFTALAAARADFFFPVPPKKWIICGGGTHNPTLMKEFQKRLSGEVLPADDLGWSSDFMEAEAFAYLAVRSLRALPLTYPGTTGVKAPQSGGVLFRPQV